MTTDVISFFREGELRNYEKGIKSCDGLVKRGLFPGDSTIGVRTCESLWRVVDANVFFYQVVCSLGLLLCASFISLHVMVGGV